jgi:hypothetical protein
LRVAGNLLATPASRLPRASASKPVSPVRSPVPIKAVYLSHFGVGDRAIRDRIFDLLDRTELNGVVIDVKGDRGFIPYQSGVPLAIDAGAQGPVRLRDFDQMLGRLKNRGIYTIARVVVFKDTVLAIHRPEWALLDARTRKPWRDNEGLAWVDPFKAETFDYAIAVAREAALKGFDEIQFDYLRFPSEGALGTIQYSKPNTQETRLRAISEFLRRARPDVGSLGAMMAVDVFGYTAFNTNDTSVGQRLEELATLVDYLCPMAYPSAYHRGIPGHPNPVAHPYEVVSETVRRTRERTAHAQVGVRPWIQDFCDYAFDRRPFGVPELHRQMKGAEDAGARGWMLWNPRNVYTAEALRRP